MLKYFTSWLYGDSIDKNRDALWEKAREINDKYLIRNNGVVDEESRYNRCHVFDDQVKLKYLSDYPDITKLNAGDTYNMCQIFNFVSSYEFSCFTNLRYNNGQNYDNYIKNVTLEINGMHIEKIRGKDMDRLRGLYGIEDRTIIPFSLLTKNVIIHDCYKSIRIIVEHNNLPENMELICDNYELDSQDFYGEFGGNICYKSTFFQTQYYKQPCLPNENTLTINLPFNNQCYYIFVDCDNIKSMKLTINGDVAQTLEPIENVFEFTPSLAKKDMEKYGINLSRIDVLTLTVELTSNTDNIDVLAITTNQYMVKYHSIIRNYVQGVRYVQ